MYAKIAATTVALASLATAQTFTSCNPLEKSCPSDPALGSEIVSVDFRKGSNSFFNVAEGTKLTYDNDKGAVFSISSESEAPTITSSKYIFFGKVDVVIQASLGVGVVTSVTLQSDDLDEIDWEWLGGDGKQVQTNFFGKGCTTVYDRGGYSAVSDPQHTFNTYTIDWTPESVKWLINGNVVRTLSASGASGCDSFPQTPMQVKLGTWVAGKKDNPKGTIDWAGGVTDFSSAPFLGYYQSVTVQDYMGGSGATSASEYSYGDNSGSWQSIKINGGNSSSGETTSTTATSSGAASSSSAASSQTSGSSSATTTLATVTSTVVKTTVTSTPSGTGSGSGSGSGNSTNTGSGSSTTPTPSTSAVTTPNAAGKLAGSLVLAGAGLLAAFLL